MSKADKMFEIIGYKNTFNNYYEHDFGTSIEFENKYKEINISGHVGIEELKAINEKVKELRMV